MPSEQKAAEAIGSLVLDYLKQTPLAVGVLVMSFFSGHLWVFVVTAVRAKTRGNKFLQTMTGRTSVGILWFSAILLPMYLLKYRSLDILYNNIVSLAVPTLLVGMVIELLLFVLFVYYGDTK